MTGTSSFYFKNYRKFTVLNLSMKKTILNFSVFSSKLYFCEWYFRFLNAGWVVSGDQSIGKWWKKYFEKMQWRRLDLRKRLWCLYATGQRRLYEKGVNSRDTSCKICVYYTKFQSTTIFIVNHPIDQGCPNWKVKF